MTHHFVVAVLASAQIAMAAPRGQAQTGPAGIAPRLRIAVLDLSGQLYAVQTVMDPNMTSTTMPLTPPPDFSRGLTQMLTTALLGYAEFVVLERPQLQKIMAEQEIGTTGRLDSTTMAKLGRVIGAQALITGDITEFNYAKSSTRSSVAVLKTLDSKVGGKVDRTSAMVAIDLRIIDATTSEVLAAVRGEGKASSTGLGVEVTSMEREIAAEGSKQTPLGAASRQAIERSVQGLVQHLRRIPWTGRIADVRGDRVYLNAGANLGIRVGMEFGVFSQSESITDPESGVTLGTPDQHRGRLRVIEVAERYAVGRMLEGDLPSRNDIIRFGDATRAP